VATLPDVTVEQLDIREKLAHIDQMLADHDRKRREIRLAWWPIFLAGMASAATLIGATAAFIKIIGGH
jgi:hypothetical protein